DHAHSLHRIAYERERAGGDDAARQRADARAVIPVDAAALRLEGDDPVHRAGVDENVAQDVCDPAGDGALSGAGGPVDGDDRAAARRLGHRGLYSTEALGECRLRALRLDVDSSSETPQRGDELRVVGHDA